jgi:hypothetical protein
MVISFTVSVFIISILILLTITFLYKFIHSIFSDRTLAEEFVQRWQRRLPHPRGRVFSSDPLPDIYLSVLFYVSSDLDITRERLRRICEYLNTNIPEKKFEILCFVPPEEIGNYSNGPSLRTQFPQVFLISDIEQPMTIRSFTCLALKARGFFLIDAEYLKEELPKLPAEPNPAYLSVIVPLSDHPCFVRSHEFIVVAAAKKAAMTVIRNLHGSEFGVGQEIELIAKEKELELNIEEKKVGAWDHALGYWIVVKLAGLMIRFMYKRKFWVLK